MFIISGVHLQLYKNKITASILWPIVSCHANRWLFAWSDETLDTNDMHRLTAFFVFLLTVLPCVRCQITFAFDDYSFIRRCATTHCTQPIHIQLL